jgi:patatin-like phospholipase/acyl hydrolase
MSFYSRRGLDYLLNKYFEDLSFDDLFVEELLVTAYEFNSKTPRFFSKTFKRINPIYDVKLKHAVGGSSSAPLYFDPLTMIDRNFDIRYTLVDGGIICNNPVFYAVLLAEHGVLNPDKPIPMHILSLGTGVPEEKKDEQYDPS